MGSDQEKQFDEIHALYERRFRTSKYFLADQLRCSEAVHDFRSVKALLDSVPQFNVRQTFQFAFQAIPTKP